MSAAAGVPIGRAQCPPLHSPPHLHLPASLMALAHRWLAERTAAWFLKQRRRGHNDEVKTEHSEPVLGLSELLLRLGEIRSKLFRTHSQRQGLHGAGIHEQGIRSQHLPTALRFSAWVNLKP